MVNRFIPSICALRLVHSTLPNSDGKNEVRLTPVATKDALLMLLKSQRRSVRFCKEQDRSYSNHYFQFISSSNTITILQISPTYIYWGYVVLLPSYSEVGDSKLHPRCHDKHLPSDERRRPRTSLIIDHYSVGAAAVHAAVSEVCPAGCPMTLNRGILILKLI